MLRKRYAIDDFLGRYPKALGHLLELKEFAEYLSYMEKHKLYEDALVMCRYQEENYIQVMRLFAHHLHRESRFKDAGLGSYRTPVCLVLS